MSSKNFCRSRRRSCWRSRAARGFGSMSVPGRASTAMKLRGDSVGAWAWGPPCSQHPSTGASGLDYLLPFPKTKSITTNFKPHAEAGLTLAPQRGCQFQAQQKRLLCIQGTQSMAKSQYHALQRGVGRAGSAQMGEALFPLNGPSLSSEGWGRGQRGRSLPPGCSSGSWPFFKTQMKVKVPPPLLSLSTHTHTHTHIIIKDKEGEIKLLKVIEMFRLWR